MPKIILSIFALIAFTACATDTPTGNEIVFTDVIGSYTGECADYIPLTSELMNREDAELTVFASSTNEAGVRTSCDRISDQNIRLKSASAAMIVFEKNIDSTKITMTYIAESDSIVLLQSNAGNSENLIFSGKRK